MKRHRFEQAEILEEQRIYHDFFCVQYDNIAQKQGMKILPLAFLSLRQDQIHIFANLLFLLVSHGHDNVQETVAAFDGDRAHDVIDLDEHVVGLNVLERIEEEIRIE